MDRRIVVFVLMLVLGGAHAGVAGGQHCAQTKMLLKMQERTISLGKVDATTLLQQEASRSNILLYHTASGLAVRGMLLGEGINESELASLGVRTHSVAGSIRTVEIPLQSLARLTDVQGVRYFELEKRTEKRLDQVRMETSVDLVHQGTGLTGPYLGKGVVVGVIDFGFDLTHPGFQDSKAALRIARVWEQTATGGNPPAGLSYGSLLANPADIIARQSTGSGTHGTHVTGIAAGSGSNTTAPSYRGIAPEAEIVMVELGRGSSNVVDAINYVFRYADSVGKPAVINMSLGSHIGPHDGTSLQDQAFNGLVGPGKILVGAAGNEGDTPLHLSHTFNGDTIATVVDLPQTPGEGSLDMWGSPQSTFAASVRMYSPTGVVRASSPWIASNNAAGLRGTIMDGQDSISFELATESASPINQRPRILMYASSTSANALVGLLLTGSGTTVHVWNNGNGNGSALRALPGAQGIQSHGGDTEYTVGEIGGTGASVISVGAYTTKNSYVNYAGNTATIPSFADLGAIAPFSSKGPTLDGRVKPDIAAPGNAVTSAISIYSSPDLNELVLLAPNSGTGSYGISYGTSMATPAITGIVALMLEGNPALNLPAVKNILQQTARKDAFTGPIPANGTNTWGAGKVDALNAVKRSVQATAIATGEALPQRFELQQNYPNPFNPVTLVGYHVSEPSQVRILVYDLLGREVTTLVSAFQTPGTYQVPLNATGLASGVYVYQMKAVSASGNVFVQTRRAMLVR